MLPFSGTDFFILMALFVIGLAIFKLFTPDKLYKHVLFVLNITFLVVFYPKPWHYFGFIIYSYVITWLFSNKLKLPLKIYGIIALLLPMLLVKFDFRFHTYPFELNYWLSFAGLSYACFRTMSYFMDKAPKSSMSDMLSYFNYLSFTPTLLIGPIDRFHHFKASADKGFSSITAENFIDGWYTVLKGVAFKYIIAECIDRYWLHLFPAESTEVLHMTNTMYAYYAYLFFDFAGYSLMALGLGKMMGMQVPVNFTNPFLAVNPQDFWKRFHISLGAWLKDYFFTPLFLWLSRFKKLKPYSMAKQNICLTATFFLMGCWNGFQKNFILSGLLFGIYSALHNWYVVSCKKKGYDVIFGKMSPALVKWISVFIMINLVSISLYIFSGYCPLI